MKKLIVYLCVLLIAFVGFLLPKSFNQLKINAKAITVVSSVDIAEKYGESYTINGDQALIKLNENKFLDFIQNYQSEAVIFTFDKTSYNDFQKKLRLENIKNIEIENIKVSYFYSPLIKQSFICQGQKINAEVAFRQDDVVVGIPSIIIGY